MQRKRNDTNYAYGILPEKAPLANPFVPFQADDPPVYEAPTGLIRGTLYPGLDLPFKGMVNKSEKADTPKLRLQTLAFALQELSLYLDTHREDTAALEMYRTYQKLYHRYMMEYSTECGPLTHVCPTEGEYRWLDDPWPWEYSANKEG